MTHYRESVPLNGADAYGSSLMNPFSFSDEELLLHVTPGRVRGPSSLRAPTLQSPELYGTSSGGLSALATLLDAGEATSAARPDAFASEAHSKSTCPPASPPRSSAAANSAGHAPSQIQSHTFDLERAETRDGLEDPADHREKNRVAQKKFRARQKVSLHTGLLLGGLKTLSFTSQPLVSMHDYSCFLLLCCCVSHSLTQSAVCALRREL